MSKMKIKRNRLVKVWEFFREYPIRKMELKWMYWTPPPLFTHTHTHFTNKTTVNEEMIVINRSRHNTVTISPVLSAQVFKFILNILYLTLTFTHKYQTHYLHCSYYLTNISFVYLQLLLEHYIPVHNIIYRNTQWMTYGTRYWSIIIWLL